MNQENKALRLALLVGFSAMVTVSTLLIRIPNPMGGYFNLGDVMIFVSALTFGPFIGGVAGGVGSAIADIIGFPLFAAPTLIIKGLEGFIAGIITNERQFFRDVLAVVFAGIEMVIGYFVVEAFILQWGVAGALAEVPGNIAQIAIGGLLGIPISYVLRKRLLKR